MGFSVKNIADRDVKRRIRIEGRIVRRVVSDALAAGYVVSVYDGEAVTVSKSAKTSQIIEACATTDEDALIIYGFDDDKHAFSRKIGIINLIYGNDGWDVISDHSVNDAMTALLVGASALADQIEEGAA